MFFARRSFFSMRSCIASDLGEFATPPNDLSSDSSDSRDVANLESSSFRIVHTTLRVCSAGVSFCTFVLVKQVN